MRHYLNSSQFDKNTLLSLLDKTSFFSQNSNPNQSLTNTIVANLFFENSTRTRFSFEIAAKKLGAHTINFEEKNSSLAKGESFYDTMKTLESLGVNMAVVRHSSDHLIGEVEDKTAIQLINAGSGKSQHPSQSLLDLFTIMQEFKTLDGLKIAICGDIKHSRVANSFCQMMNHFNSDIYLCGPEQLLPLVQLSSKTQSAILDDIINEVDVLMLLRVQLERHEELEIDRSEYLNQFGLTHERLKKMKQSAIFMHPAPINREIEIDGNLVEHPKSRIYQQSRNGVFARMAIFDWLKQGV